MAVVACAVCATVRKHFPRDPQVHPMHCLGCVHCGARLIQKHQRRQAFTPEQKRVCSRQSLQDWLALGHSEALLRKLAGATAWAVAPAPVPVDKKKG